MSKSPLKAINSDCPSGGEIALKPELADVLDIMFRLLLTVSFLLLISFQPARPDGGSFKNAPPFKDVRIGDINGVSRVIVVCTDLCTAEKDHDGSFFLSGVSGSLEVDLRQRDGFISALTIQNLELGAFLYVNTREKPADVRLADCGDLTVCIDVHHPTVSKDFRPAEIVLPAEGIRPEVLPPEIKLPVQKNKPIQHLREASLRKDQDQWADWKPEIAQKLDGIMAFPLNAETCSAHHEELQNDAWNLDAYKMVALCYAGTGDLVKAKTLLTQLQKLYPDDRSTMVALNQIATLQTGDGNHKTATLRGGS